MYSYIKDIIRKNKGKVFLIIFILLLLFAVFFPSFYRAGSRARISTIKSAFSNLESKLLSPTVNTIYKYKDNPDWHLIYKELTKFYGEPKKLHLYTERYKYSRFNNEADKINETMIPINIYKKLEMKELYFGCIVYDIKYLGKEDGLNKYHYWLYYIDKDGEFLKDERNDIVSRDQDIYEIK